MDIIENSMEVPQNTENGMTKPSTRFISKGNEINISKKYPHSHIYWSTYQNIQGIESKEYHVKWHKSDVEGQITCSHTFVEVKKKLTSQKRVE